MHLHYLIPTPQQFYIANNKMYVAYAPQAVNQYPTIQQIKCYYQHHDKILLTPPYKYYYIYYKIKSRNATHYEALM